MLRDKISIAEFELFVMTTWAVWKEICRLKDNSIHQQHTIKVDRVMSYLDEFQKAKNTIVTQISSSSGVVVKKWSKPPKGHLRFDVDAGLTTNLVSIE